MPMYDKYDMVSVAVHHESCSLICINAYKRMPGLRLTPTRRHTYGILL